MDQNSDKAIHLRGQTLTPESPRPIHVQEPSNFVILEKQMDPEFSSAEPYSVSQHHHQKEESSSSLDMNGPLDMSQRIVALQGQSRVELVRPSEAQENDGTTTQNGFSPNVPNTSFTQDTPHTLASAVPATTAAQNMPSSMPTRSISDENANSQAHSQEQPSYLNQDNQNAHINNPIQSNTNGGSANTFPLAGQPVSAASIDFNALLRSLTSPANNGAVDVSSVGNNPPQPNAVVGERSSYEAPSQEQQRQQTALSNTLQSSPFSSQLPAKPNLLPHNQNPHLAGLPLIQPSGSFQPTSAAQPSPTPQDVNMMPQATAVPPERSISPDEQEIEGSLRDGRSSEDETPWPPGVQRKYDEFLQQERKYVTEGQWDRFAIGSRLFVGNLPTERVTKRDLFHIFHKYGKLAQISIKQAYGFIQYVEPEYCFRALQAEQGGIIRGRKIHLEISKPQRPSRGAPLPPKEGGKGGSNGGSRGSGARSRKRDKDRRRDEYTNRSPSPATRKVSHRERDRMDGYRRRQRSASPRSRYRYRSPSPGPANDGDLPIPRRRPHQVPDLQIIVLDDVERDFLFLLENTFRERGLKTDVIFLSPRIKLSAVVNRHILEGVLAISKVSRQSQYSGRIPLEVYDRRQGRDNVHFNQYSELTVNVVASVVLNARSTQNVSNGASNGSYASPAPSGVPAPIAQNNLAGLLNVLGAPGLHSLLPTLGQPSGTPTNLSTPQPQSFIPGTTAPINTLAGITPEIATALRGAQQNLPTSIGANLMPYAGTPMAQSVTPNGGTQSQFGLDQNLALLLSQTGLGQTALQIPFTQQQSQLPTQPQLQPQIQQQFPFQQHLQLQQQHQQHQQHPQQPGSVPDIRTLMDQLSRMQQQPQQ